MSITNSQEFDLNTSKFLSQQINFDQDPTEQQIIDRAQELGIDDLGLAKQSLVKQLQDEWRPYINRHGQVYYINLEERKAYIDHPIDMQFKITYALKNKKKVPIFKSFKIQEISQSLDMVQKQINNYKRNQGLKVVYQESQEESVRKHTNRSVNFDDEPYEDLTLIQLKDGHLEELEKYKEEIQKTMKQELEDFRKAKQNQFTMRTKRHQLVVQQLKNQRLKQIGSQFQSEWVTRNQASYHKAIQNTMQELDIKKYKFQDLLQKELLLTESMYSLEEIRIDYKMMNRNKIANKKIGQKQQLKHQLAIDYVQSFKKQVQNSLIKFNNQSSKLLGNRINYQDCIDRNIQQLTQLTKNNQNYKKRFSIFHSEAHDSKKVYEENQQDKLARQLNVTEKIWTKENYLVSQYVPQTKGNLSMRLYRKII